MHLVWDLEGLVPAGTKGDFAEATQRIHCLCVKDLHTGEARSFDDGAEYADEDLSEGLRLLSDAECIYGHNVTRYDLPVVRRLFPDWKYKGLVYDTLMASQVIYPGPKWLRLADQRWVKKPGNYIPNQLMGRHSLEAWGYRIGENKQEYDEGFEVYTPVMLGYNVQDVETNWELVKRLQTKGQPDSVIHTESAVSEILYRQERYGVAFNTQAAVDLMLPLQDDRDALTTELQTMFPAKWKLVGKVVVPKVKNGPRGVAVGGAYQKVKLVDFKPGSSAHIAERLKEVHGWVPNPGQMTPGGDPQTTEEVLSDLDYPCIPLLLKYMQATKILGFISEGKNAWLRLVTPEGRIHGRVSTTGTVTNRMSHSNPNCGQVPKVGSYLGEECRGLFRAGSGRVLVGADASGLQLRELAHYLAKFDGGAFALAVSEGDPHLYMMEGTGILVRNDQKTFTYAKLFSAWFKKLGMIKINSFREMARRGEWTGTIPSNNQAVAVGKAADEGLSKLLKLDDLDKGLDAAWDRRFVISHDGRRVPVLSRRQCLNTLLMSGEAVVMKRGLLICDRMLREKGFTDWEFVLNVHDEWQIECNRDDAEGIGAVMVAAIQGAGESFGLMCRLDGEYKVGATWADTH